MQDYSSQTDLSLLHLHLAAVLLLAGRLSGLLLLLLVPVSVPILLVVFCNLDINIHDIRRRYRVRTLIKIFKDTGIIGDLYLVSVLEHPPRLTHAPAPAEARLGLGVALALLTETYNYYKLREERGKYLY